MRGLFLSCLCLMFYNFYGNCQTKLPDHDNKIITISIVPGISSSGLQPRKVIDQVSLNLFSGYSAATEGFAFAIIQNLNTSFSKGLFIAGITNITGVNSNENKLKNEEQISYDLNLEGLQIAGFLNFVKDNAFGSQLAGIVNVTQGGFFGLQGSGIGNIVNKYTFGAQLAGIFNISSYSISGVQVSSLFNYTKERLEGIQLSTFNMSGIMQGKNSEINKPTVGIQIGLFNKSRQMDGFQIGLINIGKKMQGTQIGLINIAGSGSTKLTRDGTTIGLLNFGNSLYSQVYMDEQLFLNYEIGTGIVKNSRMQSDINKYVYSSLTYSKAPAMQRRQYWMAGFGVFKLWAPRDIRMGEYYLSSAGVQLLHYNAGKKVNESLNPILRFRYMYGRRINKKLGNIYLFAAVTGNILYAKQENSTTHEFQLSTKINAHTITSWPGFQIGIMTK